MEFIPKNFYRVFENFDHEISLLLILINLQGLQDLTLFPNSIKKPTKHVPFNVFTKYMAYYIVSRNPVGSPNEGNQLHCTKQGIRAK